MKKHHPKSSNSLPKPTSEPPKPSQHVPLTIKFNLTKDTLACFVGQKKISEKKSKKGYRSKRAHKKYQSVFSDKHENTKENENKKGEILWIGECEQIFKQSLNSIVKEIEEKGLQCIWSQGEEDGQIYEQQDTSQIWSVSSVNVPAEAQLFNPLHNHTQPNDSSLKSYGSTMDLQTQNSYYSGYSYSQYGQYDQYVSQNYDHYSFTNDYQNYGNTQYYSYSSRNYSQGRNFNLRPESICNDPRTTIMIRNVPNKYTIKQLSEEIDQCLPNCYDFLYLPCDIKNQCNVGYGFINFVNTQKLLQFYEEFQGKGWNKFRSDKICNLTYARLQGLNSLIQHFQNSKVLNQKDKKYRPIIRSFDNIGTLVKSQQLI